MSSGSDIRQCRIGPRTSRLSNCAKVISKPPSFSWFPIAIALFTAQATGAELYWVNKPEDLSDPRSQWLREGGERFGKDLQEAMGNGSASALGTVWMGITVARSGETASCLVLMSDGNRTFEQKALSACRQVRYGRIPSDLHPDATAVRFSMPIRLRGSPGQDYDVPRIRFGCDGPIWPPAAGESSDRPLVKLRLSVSARGEVTSHRIVGSSGRPDLDTATVEGYSKCSFAPAFKRGKPVAGEVYLEHHWIPESALEGVPLGPLT